jgi:hypothetical protein
MYVCIYVCMYVCIYVCIALGKISVLGADCASRGLVPEFVCMCILYASVRTYGASQGLSPGFACMYIACASVKLIAFELAAKFSRRRENPVQPRLCNA